MIDLHFIFRAKYWTLDLFERSLQQRHVELLRELECSCRAGAFQPRRSRPECLCQDSTARQLPGSQR